MIVPDVNLLVYAHDEATPYHDRARRWWEDLASRAIPVAVPWAVVFGFVRLTTHPDVMRVPLTAGEALDRVESWLALDHVRVLDPGPRHLAIARRMFEATGVAGRLTTDTHIAALAIEYQAEVHSNDLDFGRFPGLRWHNPLG